MSTPVAIQAGVSATGSQPLIGIVDDDPIMGKSLVQRLQLEGYRASWWQSGEEALAHLRDADCQVLVCDIRLPDMDGEQLFRRALPDLGATPVMFITAFGEVEQAVRLMRAGADDYVTKPFDVKVLLRKIATLCRREITAGNGSPGRETLSASAAMRRVKSELLRVKDTTMPVLLLGETGVGKEVAARQLHEASLRHGLPFVVVSCATIPVDRAEHEMFGHERGAVAGSRTAHVGFVEQAGGVLCSLTRCRRFRHRCRANCCAFWRMGAIAGLGERRSLCLMPVSCRPAMPICRRSLRRRVLDPISTIG